jgi:hypothetical protein
LGIRNGFFRLGFVGFPAGQNGDRERRMRCWARPDLHSPDLRSHGLAVEDVIGEVREKKKKKKKKRRKPVLGRV